MSENNKSPFKQPDLKQLQTWVYESMWASREWRRQSWRSQELMDGGKAQWTTEKWDEALEIGVDPITINRIFPTVNLVLGYHVLNQYDMIAKGRTHKDSELSQIMTEGIAFVMDSYDGKFLIQQAFKDACVPGFGCMSTVLNDDPRQERVAIEWNDWKEVNWDPFGNPWWEPKKTRYVYKHRWMDLDALKTLFWTKRKDIEEQFSEFTGQSPRYRQQADFQDEATWKEEYITGLTGSDWSDIRRRRVRPVEMWYTVPERALFALFADGRYIELTDDMPIMTQYQIIQGSQELAAAIVYKMKVCSFFGDVELQRLGTPYPHDQFPLVPFVGYVDRYGFPYGLPMQVEGMQEEVNARRSMAKALLKSRRVMAEETAFEDANGKERAYEEANKLDGFILLADGALGAGKFKIIENAELASSQVKLMEQSENEINEIVGANLAAMGYESNETSGIAIERRQKQAAVVIAPLFENLRRSMKRLGEQISANIQGFWNHEKILRVTDRLTGAEKFIEINKKVQVEGGAYAIKNNIAQGKFDMVVTEAPQSDTTKEKNLDLLMAAIQKSPPEVIPILLTTAFELMDLPNKEIIMSHIKPLFGMDQLEDEMTSDQRKQKIMQELEAQKQQAQKKAAVMEQAAALEMQKKDLENKKLAAEIGAIMEKVKTDKAQVVANMRNNVMQLRQAKTKTKEKAANS